MSPMFDETEFKTYVVIIPRNQKVIRRTFM